jgi:uncharacterized protein HemX
MPKFFIHKDDEQQGPFTTDELKDLKITRETMVWFEGADDWKKAIEIEELQEIFKGVPPPFQTNQPEIPTPIEDKQIIEKSKSTVDISLKKKNTSLIIIIIAVLVIGSIGTLLYLNQQAEMHRQLEVQQAKIQQQELESLKSKYNQAITNFRTAEIELNEIQKFQLLRTASEKQQQIQEQLEYIRSWENEVDRLKKEIDKY